MGRPRTYNRQQIADALTRLTPAVIADRLGCSLRTVQRVTEERPHLKRLDGARLHEDECGTDAEWRMWQMDLDAGASITDVARTYCRSRPTVYKGLSRIETST